MARIGTLAAKKGTQQEFVLGKNRKMKKLGTWWEYVHYNHRHTARTGSQQE